MDFSGISSVAFMIAIVFAILIMLAIREIVCWYLKFNKMVKQNDEIIGLLRSIEAEIKVFTMLEARKGRSSE
ncbi:MAG: hypothetical protein ACOXZ4_07415 [Sphaerochaetaceae bacterium]